MHSCLKYWLVSNVLLPLLLTMTAISLEVTKKQQPQKLLKTFISYIHNIYFIHSLYSFLPFLSRNVSNTLSCRPLLPRKMLRNLPFLLLGTSYSSFSLYIQTVLFQFYPEALLEISFEILRLYLHYNPFV